MSLSMTVVQQRVEALRVQCLKQLNNSHLSLGHGFWRWSVSLGWAGLAFANAGVVTRTFRARFYGWER